MIPVQAGFAESAASAAGIPVVATGAVFLGIAAVGALAWFIRRRAASEQRVRDSLELTRAILNSTSHLILAADAQGRIMGVNPAVATLMGCEEADAVGRPLVELFVPEELQARAAELHGAGPPSAEHAFAAAVGAAVSGGTEEREWHFRRADGSPVPVLAATTALLDARGAVRGYAVVASDISALKRAEYEASQARVEAERANRVKSEFLSNMSHELRTPLNSVIGFANILLKNRHNTLREQDIGFLQRIASNGRHLLGLINGILDLSKVEAGRIELEVTPVDVSDLVRETVGEMESQALARDLRLVADVPAEPTYLNTDRHRLKQTFINLVGNALKFTAQGSVTIRVVRDDATGRAARIEFIDTGCGIPADKLETIFEAFRQADSTTARQYGGTGLGLTITRSLAQLMGFDVRAESTVGVGSTFTIVTEPWAVKIRTGDPLRARTPAAESLPAAFAARSPRAKLALVIDDEPDARIMLAQHLQDLGCEVVAAASADEGVALARRLHPDLITLDVMMPGRNGIDALRELKSDATLSRIPVVVVSVVAEEYRGRVFGAVDCIDKPVTREALSEVLRRNVTSAAAPRVMVLQGTATPGALPHDLQADGASIETVRTLAEARRAFDAGRVPHLLVLDVTGAEQDVFAWIGSLREDPRVRFVPIVVVVPDEQAATTRRVLAHRATVLSRNLELAPDLRGIIAALQDAPGGAHSLMEVA